MAKKRSSLVMARNTKIKETGLRTSKGTLHFNGNSGMHVSDPGLVAEIESQYGRGGGTGDVWTHQDEHLEHQRNYHEDGIHHYMFSGVGPASGNERVRVRTATGTTIVSRQVAREEKLEIVTPRKRK